MVCPKCGGGMQMQTVSENQKRGCGTILFYILLLFIPVIGWVALAVLIFGKGKLKGVTYAVCQNCGHRVKIDN